jgi:hypothetical protein
MPVNETTKLKFAPEAGGSALIVVLGAANSEWACWIELDYAENEELCRGDRVQVDLIAQALDAPRQPVDQVVASMFVEVVGP